MNQQQLFELGSKLIGVYCIVISFPSVVSGVFEILALKGTGEKMAGSFRLISTATFILGSSILFGIGLLLFKRASSVRQIAFPDELEVYDSQLEEPFTVGIKLFGLFLFIRTVPTFFRLLSNYVFVATSSYDSAPIVAKSVGIMTDFLPSLISLLFGSLLFFRGELLSRWAFTTRRDIENPDPDQSE